MQQPERWGGLLVVGPQKSRLAFDRDWSFCYILSSVDHMPTYEYHCEKCEQTFEAFQSMKDEPFKICPKELCRQDTWGKGIVKRQLGTGAGLIFKGSGFYITDYRSPGYKESAKKEGNLSTGDGAKGGEKADGGSKGGPAKGSSEKSSDTSKTSSSTGT
jgi:putative FmdB family regulatory protein